jgi:hypothetical protein
MMHQSLATNQLPAEIIEGFVTMIKMFQSELPKKNAYDLAFMVESYQD